MTADRFNFAAHLFDENRSRPDKVEHVALALHKYPRHVVFIAELPKTATGKVQRFKLREG